MKYSICGSGDGRSRARAIAELWNESDPRQRILFSRQDAERQSLGKDILSLKNPYFTLTSLRLLRESQSVFVVFVTANLDKSDAWLRRRREFAYKSKGLCPFRW